MIAREGPRDAASPIVSNHVEALCVEGGRHREHVVAELGDAVCLDTLGSRALRVPALIRGDGAIPGIGEIVQRVMPAASRLRESVEQEHKLSVGRTRGERVEAHAARRDGRVPHSHATERSRAARRPSRETARFVHDARMADALFTPHKRGYVPSDHARGPWDRGAMHGGPPAALMAAVMEALPTDSPMAVVRTTVEIFRPVPLRPVEVAARIERPGHRVQMLTATLTDGNTELCRATAWRMRIADLTLGELSRARGAVRGACGLDLACS